MAYDGEKADFKAIAGNAKKSAAYQKLGGGDDEPDPDDAGGSDEDADLGDAFAALSSKDEAGFKTAMAAAMRACYRSMK